VFLTTDSLRARYRESLAKPRPVPIGAPTRYDLTGFRWFARRLAKGSRLRLVVGAFSDIDTEKNYGTGGVVADESGASARVAHVKLLHDAEHPSALELPLGKLPLGK
jgi:predicted acyl esterase